ncbi:MAG: restriction endonuclease subunit S [Hyphomicrobiaceae bacterium]
MNAERLLAHYDKIADAPDAIARLRRFILDLAVRGKLVAQDAKDEPASDLLKRIAKEKARLVKAGEIRKDKPLPPVDEDADFDVPATWRWTRLGAVTSYIQRGKSPKYAASDGSPVVSQKCVQWRGLDLSVAKQITVESLTDYEDIRFLRDGDLLWNSTGTGTIGRVVRLSHTPEKLVCDSHVTVVRCLNVDPEYIRIWLQSDHVYALIEDRAAGSTNQVELTAQMAINQVVPLPPLAEQRRIVAKVDELMGLCERLEATRTGREAARDRLAAASLARLNAPDPETFQSDARFALDVLPALTTRPDQIKALRQTILNLAVRGKLVPQDPNDEPASELLKRIAKERTGPEAMKKARRKGEPDVSSLRTDTPLPVGWLWTNIDEIALSMRYGTSTKCEYAAPGVPVLRIPNVSDGVVSLDDIKFGPLTDGEIRDLALNAGDLLMIRSNGSLDIVGRSAVVTPEADGMAFAGYLVRLRLSVANIKPEYIWQALNSTDVRGQIEKPIRSAVGLKNVNLTEFGALTIPLPPLAEQHRIVAKVDALMALCDRLEASLTATAATRRRLLDALLAEALAPAEDRELEAAE